MPASAIARAVLTNKSSSRLPIMLQITAVQDAPDSSHRL